MQRFLQILTLAAGLEAVCVAQNAPQQAPAQNPPTQTADESRTTPAPAMTGLVGLDAQSTEEDTHSDLPQIPTLLGGRRTSMAFTPELERSNYLRGGLSVGAAYDDNTFLQPSDAVGNTSYSVFPNISIEQTTSRTRLTLGYAGGLTVNQRFTNHNQGSHALNFDTQFRLSPHVDLGVSEDFSMTSGVFNTTDANPVQNGIPNPSLVTPLSTQRASLTVAQVNYHFALKDLVGASGSFYDLHYGNVPAASGTLVNSRTASGSAFWLHGLFRGDWAGVSYDFERLTFDPSGGETQVHSFMLVNTYNLAKSFTVSGYVGPQHSNNRVPGSNTAQEFSSWSVAGGLDANWHNARTSVGAGYSRRVSDGGGLLGPVNVQEVHGSLRRELFPGWSATFHGGYGNNKSLTIPIANTASSIKTATAGATLERNIGKSWTLAGGYTHDFQDQTGIGGSPFLGSAQRNRVLVTLGYQWAKGLGR